MIDWAYIAIVVIVWIVGNFLGGFLLGALWWAFRDGGGD